MIVRRFRVAELRAQHIGSDAQLAKLALVDLIVTHHVVISSFEGAVLRVYRRALPAHELVQWLLVERGLLIVLLLRLLQGRVVITI